MQTNERVLQEPTGLCPARAFGQGAEWARQSGQPVRPLLTYLYCIRAEVDMSEQTGYCQS